MKITLSERQKCVLAATAVGVFVLNFFTIFFHCLFEFGFTGTSELLEKYGVYTHWLFFSINILLGMIVIRKKKKEHLFELWCLSSLIFTFASLAIAFVQYVIISRLDRGKWKLIDFILIATALILFHFDITSLEPLVFFVGLF